MIFAGIVCPAIVLKTKPIPKITDEMRAQRERGERAEGGRETVG
jgi:hypothetical protein